jgi:hypothetical protein
VLKFTPYAAEWDFQVVVYHGWAGHGVGSPEDGVEVEAAQGRGIQ